MTSFRIAIIAIVFFATHAFSAERPKGFMGIHWGASPEEAKRVLQARPGVKFPDETDDYKFELTGGTFAGQAVEKWTLEFPERKFAAATVVLKKKENTPSLYKEFRAQLSDKYGSSTSSSKIKGLTKQAAGNRTIYGSIAVWKFMPNIKDKNYITIHCELATPTGMATVDETQLEIKVRYCNETLLKESALVEKKPDTEAVKKDEL
jgi:hypothetical protein